MSWSRGTGTNRINDVMTAAEITGVHAVAHAVNKTPLPSLQKWLGHEDMQTTAIYMQATGEEERELASGVW